MRRAFPMLVSFLALAACAGAGDNAADSANDSVGAAAAPRAGAGAGSGAAPATTTDTGRAAAAVVNANGRNIGTLNFTQTAQGIAVSGRLTGLRPGAHGIHIHMVGQCAPPFESAGGHWNPTNRQHGSQNAQGPHFGDLPNITVAADSSVTVQGTTAGGTLRGANALMDTDGAAIVIHADPDDDRTDPSGNSGARVACGVISTS